MSKAKKATAGLKLACKFCKFPDGRIVYGPVWATEMAKAIDRLITRERRKERDQCVQNVDRVFAIAKQHVNVKHPTCDQALEMLNELHRGMKQLLTPTKKGTNA